ncbi:RipA family octameric membrane protein [Ewingella sp. AOP8-B2-18]
MTTGSNTNADVQAEDEDLHAVKRLYELTIKIRDFEITQLSQRNNFFMLFQGVIFAGLATLLQNDASRIYAPALAVIGTIVSLLQIGISSGAKYWQEYWEEAVKDTEIELIRIMELKKIKGARKKIYKIFSISMSEVDEKVKRRLSNSHSNCIIKALILKKFSVSRIPIWAGIFFLLTWVIYLIFYLLNLFFGAKVIILTM